MFPNKEGKGMSFYLTALDKRYKLYKYKGSKVCSMIPQRVEEGENLVAYSLRLTQAMSQFQGSCSWMHDFYEEGKLFVRDTHKRWVEREEDKYLVQMFEAIILILPWEVYSRTHCIFGEYLYTLKATNKKSFLFTTLLKCLCHERFQSHPMTALLKGATSQL